MNLHMQSADGEQILSDEDDDLTVSMSAAPRSLLLCLPLPPCLQSPALPRSVVLSWSQAWKLFTTMMILSRILLFGVIF